MQKVAQLCRFSMSAGIPSVRHFTATLPKSLFVVSHKQMNQSIVIGGDDVLLKLQTEGRSPTIQTPIGWSTLKVICSLRSSSIGTTQFLFCKPSRRERNALSPS